MTPTPLTKRRLAGGFTLIEVLVALLVMAFGMLGIVSLLLVTTRSNTSSILKQQAVQSAYNIVDRMRANAGPAAAGSYNVDDRVVSGTPTYPAAPRDCSRNSCSTAQLSAYDTWYWLTKDVVQLPLGTGAIATQPSGSNTLVTVTVQWDDSPSTSTAAQGGLGLGAAAQSVTGSPNIAKFVIATLL